MKVQLSLMVEKDFKKKIDSAAIHLTVSTAAFIRMACMEYANKILETKTDDDKA